MNITRFFVKLPTEQILNVVQIINNTNIGEVNMVKQRTTVGWNFDGLAVGLGVRHTGFEIEVLDSNGDLFANGFETPEVREYTVDLVADEAYTFNVRAVASNAEDNGPWSSLEVVVGDLTPQLPAVEDLAVVRTELVEVDE